MVVAAFLCKRKHSAVAEVDIFNVYGILITKGAEVGHKRVAAHLAAAGVIATAGLAFGNNEVLYLPCARA